MYICMYEYLLIFVPDLTKAVSICLNVHIWTVGYSGPEREKAVYAGAGDGFFSPIHRLRQPSIDAPPAVVEHRPRSVLSLRSRGANPLLPVVCA